ncbi:MAG: sulfatase [Planctomycetota bacterium]|nr:MAG: sulfatase [Planctomycetota bacterium]
MNPAHEIARYVARRTFLGHTASRLGSAALGVLLAGDARRLAAASSVAADAPPALPHFPAKAKRVVCLFQSGGLSHVDLFDYKPALDRFNGQEIPPSVKGAQRLTGMTSGQSAYPVVAPFWPGRFCGRQRTWISDLLPQMQTIADDLCVVKSLHTEAINHDPAITFMNTGNQQPGYASMGAWVSYGLGSENENLPTFIAMVSQGSGKNPGQPIFSRLWGNGFLPSSHQGVGLRPGSSPVLYLQDPPGTDRRQRRALLDDLARLNQLRAEELGDPETIARINAYEMAFRMQTSVPELTDASEESPATLASYGPEAAKPGSYAANCLLARRLLERGVRFVQLFHRGWDQHIAIQRQLPNQCRDVDQPTAALVKDLKQRGLLEDTLVVFLTEFGRTVFSQGALGSPAMGRDHHGRCFTVWLAGAGVKAGMEYGKTDDFCYNIAENAVHLRDLHATMLHCLGIDHARFTYPFRGLDVRLTGVEEARVVKEILA